MSGVVRLPEGRDGRRGMRCRVDEREIEDLRERLQRGTGGTGSWFSMGRAVQTASRRRRRRRRQQTHLDPSPIRINLIIRPRLILLNLVHLLRRRLLGRRCRRCRTRFRYNRRWPCLGGDLGLCCRLTSF